MLLHYFDSKEALIAEVIEQVQERLRDSFRDLLEEPQTKKNLLPRFWNVLSSKKNQPFLRLLFEVQMLALQNPRRYRRYLKRTSKSWRRLIETALPVKRQSEVTATLCNAIVDGLLLELLSTGDARRTSRALALFTEHCVPKM